MSCFDVILCGIEVYVGMMLMSMWCDLICVFG